MPPRPDETATNCQDAKDAESFILGAAGTGNLSMFFDISTY
jgi:hypothetical protein